MAIVFEASVTFHQLINDGFAFVTKWRMAKIVREGNGLGEIFIEP